MMNIYYYNERERICTNEEVGSLIKETPVYSNTVRK